MGKGLKKPHKRLDAWSLYQMGFDAAMQIFKAD